MDIVATNTLFIRYTGLKDLEARYQDADAMARRIGVRAQFGDASATHLKLLGRIGIRPQICYTRARFEAARSQARRHSSFRAGVSWLNTVPLYLSRFTFFTQKWTQSII